MILFFYFCRGVVFKVMFHPKQLMIISAGDDAEVRVWDLITKSCAGTLKVRYSYTLTREHRDPRP